MRNAGVEYIVYKNTLINLALEELGIKGMGAAPDKADPPSLSA
jgi:ribosomal protein L10